MYDYAEFERIHGCSELELILPIWCEIYDAVLERDQRLEEEARREHQLKWDRIRKEWEEQWKKRMTKENGTTWEKWWAEVKRVCMEELHWGDGSQLPEALYRSEYDKNNTPELALLENY